MEKNKYLSLLISDIFKIKKCAKHFDSGELKTQLNSDEILTIHFKWSKLNNVIVYELYVNNEKRELYTELKSIFSSIERYANFIESRDMKNLDKKFKNTKEEKIKSKIEKLLKKLLAVNENKNNKQGM